MAISSGDELGPYEILSAVGAGAMGEVYKARDTRLDRLVAIKVLPEHILKRSDSCARFEREARTVASLNHPHICALYDIGDKDGSRYMVMELLDGDTLSARIAKGALPLQQALALAAQIADALDCAHRAGVTHRDVKPGNIMLTRNGVKVLDFGLAKSTSKPGPNDATLTTEGILVGTPQYMAPEQFEGREADARSDVWAFGAVLYEMVTGQKAFQGKSYSSLVGAILSADPPPLSVKPFTPSWLERLVRRCLAKEPEERWQSMRDIVLELKSPPLPETVPARSMQRLWVAATAGVSLLLCLALWRLWDAKSIPEVALQRLHLDLGSAPPGPSNAGPTVVLSPDGSRVVYVAQTAEGSRLYTRRLAENQSHELTGTAGGYGPFFSPDGNWIGFFAGGKLQKMPVNGGSPVTLCAAPLGRGASWGEDGYIVAALSPTAALYRIAASGGKPIQFSRFSGKERTHRWPEVLPGAESVIFTAHQLYSEFDDATIELIKLSDNSQKTLHRGGTFGHYLSSGHLTWLSRGGLFAATFDLRRLEVTGAPFLLLDDVEFSMLNGSGQFTVSRRGHAVYRSGRGDAQFRVLSWMDLSGKTTPLRAKPDYYFAPALSPDGRRIALNLQSDIYLYDLDRGSNRRLTFNGGATPAWTPDGEFVFSAWEGRVSWVRADGGDSPKSQVLTKNSGGNLRVWPFAPDGKRLAFTDIDPETGSDIWTVPVVRERTELRLGPPEVFLKTPFHENAPSFSPDGRWMAYHSNQSGTDEVYVRAFPDKGERWQISFGGGLYPKWSPTTKELFFRTVDSRMMVVPYEVT